MDWKKTQEKTGYNSKTRSHPGCIPYKRHAEGFKIQFFFTPRNLKSHTRNEKMYAVTPRS